MSEPLLFKSASSPRTVFSFVKQPSWQIARACGESAKQTRATVIRTGGMLVFISGEFRQNLASLRDNSPQARIADSSSKTRSGFHPLAQRNAFRCRDVRQQSVVIKLFLALPGFFGRMELHRGIAQGIYDVDSFRPAVAEQSRSLSIFLRIPTATQSTIDSITQNSSTH